MSLLGALNTGKTALAVHQAAIQVTGNNVANAGNPEYTRQVARVVPRGDYPTQAGVMIGTGVSLVAVERQIDEALEERLRSSFSDNESAGVHQYWLGRVEAIFHELGDDDLSSQLSQFFANWSNLANAPHDTAQRQLVLNSGESLANTIRNLRFRLSTLREDMDKRMTHLAGEANTLADRVAQLNGQIVAAEGSSGGTAAALRDQRDAALKELSKLIDITTQQTSDGTVNVFVGSTPLVLDNINRGLTSKQESDGTTISTRLTIKADGASVKASSGQAGALLRLQDELVGVIDHLDSLAGGLIFELNHLHSQGQGSTPQRIVGLAEVTATHAVSDSTAALNADAAGLAFKPINGTFEVHVRRKSDGGIISLNTVKVNLSDSGGDSLDDLAAKLDALDGVSASVIGGKLKVEAEDKSAAEITFGEDHSYVLAALGINAFFTGTSAADIALKAELKSSPALLAAANNDGANANASAIAALETRSLDHLGGVSLQKHYETMINGVAVSAASAKSDAEAALAVLDTLTAQREALSGVSLDEEAINLMREQRAYQAAARIVAAVDELMQTLLQMV